MLEPLKIILTARAQRRADGLRYKVASKRASHITRQAMRDMRRIAQAEERLERQKATQAELPAGKIARVNHRAEQAASLASSLASIVASLVQIKMSFETFRSTPNSDGNPS